MDDRYQQKKKSLLSQATELQQMAERLSARQVTNKLEDFVGKLQDEHFFVTVVGEFSRGKSTLMNAFLGENILPTAIRPTTALLTFIHNGPEKTVQVYDKAGRRKDIPWDKKALKEFTALRDVDTEKLPFMELSVPLTDFPEDMVLVDTPGVNDVSQQRMDVTYQYIPISDAVVFVLTVRQPLTQSEWTFLKDFVSESARRYFFFILNFKDDVAETELADAVADVKRRLAVLIPQKEIHLYLMSAKEALQGKENGDAVQLAASGYTAWQQDFQAFLQDESRQQLKLQRYQEHLHEIKQMFLEFVTLREQENQLQKTDCQAVSKALQEEKFAADERFEKIRVHLTELKEKWTREVKCLLQNASGDFLQEQRININAIEREKDVVRYAEEVLPLALQRHWKQWLEYRQDQLLNMVNNDLQKLAQAYCDSFSERQIFFDVCQRARVQVMEQQPVHLEGKEDIRQAETIGQVGTALVIGGMALVSGFALAAIPLVAFGGKNLGDFITQRFYVDEKLREQQEQLKEELPRLLDDTAMMIEEALLKEFSQTADKMAMTLRHDFQLVWHDLEQRISQNNNAMQQAETDCQMECLALEACKENILMMGRGTTGC